MLSPLACNRSACYSCCNIRKIIERIKFEFFFLFVFSTISPLNYREAISDWKNPNSGTLNYDENIWRGIRTHCSSYFTFEKETFFSRHLKSFPKMRFNLQLVDFILIREHLWSIFWVHTHIHARTHLTGVVVVNYLIHYSCTHLIHTHTLTPH